MELKEKLLDSHLALKKNQRLMKLSKAIEVKPLGYLKKKDFQQKKLKHGNILL